MRAIPSSWCAARPKMGTGRQPGGLPWEAEKHVSAGGLSGGHQSGRSQAREPCTPLWTIAQAQLGSEGTRSRVWSQRSAVPSALLYFSFSSYSLRDCGLICSFCIAFGKFCFLPPVHFKANKTRHRKSLFFFFLFLKENSYYYQSNKGAKHPKWYHTGATVGTFWCTSDSFK